MSKYASLDDLTAAADRSEDFELPSGRLVRIRPLTRGEAFTFSGKGLPVDVMEQRMVSLGLVEPTMTPKDVKAWQDHGAAGEIGALSDRITEISGMTKQAAKAAMLDFRDQS